MVESLNLTADLTARVTTHNTNTSFFEGDKYQRLGYQIAKCKRHIYATHICYLQVKLSLKISTR